MKILKTISFFFLTGILMSCNFQNNCNTQVLPAHAHNDYEHERPLLDAMDCKFKSIEADVYAIGDSLFVAHDFDKIGTGRTLRQLYLDPLKNIVNSNNGSVYGNGEEIIILVDFKSEGLKTYKLLHQILEGYKDILTHYNSGKKVSGAIQIIVSGNRPFEYMQNQEVRYAGYDGRISELDLEISPLFMPLVSDNWNNHFKWRGVGEMPADEKNKLSNIMEKARKNGYLIRFWATPERPEKEREAVWAELKNARVDLISTDNLKGLQSMFLKEK
ncbi:MAG: hypothetical protein HQ522_07225 [Bacteroidetes bacterium]|nr:hypothetical protein [Bacteroidota bacterium]